MRRSAAVVFLVGLFPSHALAEPGIRGSVAALEPLKGFIAVAEVGSPPGDVGATLWDWDHITQQSVI